MNQAFRDAQRAAFQQLADDVMQREEAALRGDGPAFKRPAHSTLPPWRHRALHAIVMRTIGWLDRLDPLSPPEDDAY